MHSHRRCCPCASRRCSTLGGPFTLRTDSSHHLCVSVATLTAISTQVRLESGIGRNQCSATHKEPTGESFANPQPCAVLKRPSGCDLYSVLGWTELALILELNESLSGTDILAESLACLLHLMVHELLVPIVVPSVWTSKLCRKSDEL